MVDAGDVKMRSKPVDRTCFFLSCPVHRSPSERMNSTTLHRRPEARGFRVETLLQEAAGGRLRIPPFQRPLRWRARTSSNSSIRSAGGFPWENCCCPARGRSSDSPLATVAEITSRCRQPGAGVGCTNFSFRGRSISPVDSVLGPRKLKFVHPTPWPFTPESGNLFRPSLLGTPRAVDSVAINSRFAAPDSWYNAPVDG